MRPKLDRSIELPADDPLNFGVLVRLRISNLICRVVSGDARILRDREIEILPELIP